MGLAMQFNYPVDATLLEPEEVEGLLLKHITTRRELDRWEQENIAAAQNWLQRAHKKNILSEDFVKKLHKRMFSKVWTWAGAFRKSEKNIGITWTRVPTELRVLLNDVAYWLEHGTYSNDEIAVRFHHRLVSIHCFPNGNGRHARLMTEVILLSLLHAPVFTWGSGDLMNQNQVRDQYIHALRYADDGDYTPLMHFVRS